MSPTPERLIRAVDKLALTGGESILEIGCGRGVAISLVCALLSSGTIIAIDRSATAIRAARERNKAFVTAGKAIFHEAEIEAFDGENGAFDVVFAVNVNLFWLDAKRGLDSVRLLLARDGKLFLFYEPPSPGQRAKIATILPEKLAASGFEVEETEQVDRSNLIAIVARPVGS